MLKMLAKVEAGHTAAVEGGAGLRLENVSLSIERSTHADHTDPRNEVLSNLLAFLRLLVRPRSATGRIFTQCLLRDVSVSVPAGSVVGVMSTVPASARGLLEIVSNAAVPDQGKVIRAGRVASFGQIWCMPSAYDSCRRNLQLLGELLGAPQDAFQRAFDVVEQFNKRLPVLDMPLRRTPRWAFSDLALVLICELGYEVLVVPEVMLPTSGDVEDYWLAYVGGTRERGQVIVLGSRRPDNVVPLSTHLLLMDGSDLVDFGPAAEVRKQHSDVVLRALEAREEPKYTIPLPESVEDDEDDDEEEEDARIIGDEQSASAIEREAASEGNIPGPLPSQPRLAAGVSYSERTSELCEIVAAGTEGGSGLFRLDDMSPAEPIDDVAELAAGLENAALHGGAAKSTSPMQLALRNAELPAIYREEGAVIRVVLETKAPNLWLLPIVDLVRTKLIALRSFGPNEVFVPQPARVAFNVEIPPGLLQRRLYSVNAVICIADRDRGIETIAISKDFFTFLNLSKERPERSTPFLVSPNLETLFRCTAQINDEPADIGARFRLAAVSLEDVSGNPLMHDEDGFEAPRAASDGFNVVLNVDVGSRPRKLVCLVDLRHGQWVALRLTPAPVELAPGGHRLTVTVPGGLLAPNRFEVHVEMVEHEPVAGVGDVQALAAVVRVPIEDDVESDDRLMRWRYGTDHGLLQAKLTWKYGDAPMSKVGGGA